MFDNLCETLHRELKDMDNKYADDIALSEQDLDHIDKMAHALKCIVTYDAMTGDGYERRTRSTGRYRDDHYRRY